MKKAFCSLSKYTSKRIYSSMQLTRLISLLSICIKCSNRTWFHRGCLSTPFSYSASYSQWPTMSITLTKKLLRQKPETPAPTLRIISTWSQEAWVYSAASYNTMWFIRKPEMLESLTGKISGLTLICLMGYQTLPPQYWHLLKMAISLRGESLPVWLLWSFGSRLCTSCNFLTKSVLWCTSYSRSSVTSRFSSTY